MDERREMPVAPGARPKLFYGYVIAFAAFVILALVIGIQYSFGIFFAPLLDEFGWTRASISGAYSINMILQAVTGLFAGRFTDRFGPRKVLTVCAVLAGLGYILMSQVNSIWQIYLFYGVLASAINASAFVALLSTIARWFVKRRGLMSGIVVSGIGVGTIVMPIVAETMISSYSWRISYVVLGVALIIIAGVGAQFLRQSPKHMGLQPYGAAEAKSGQTTMHPIGLSPRQVLRARQFWILVIGFYLFNFCIQGMMVHIVPHALDVGLPPATAAIILSVVGAVSMVAKIAFGASADRFGNRRVMALGCILFVAAFVWLQFANVPWMFWLYATIFGLGYAAYITLESPVVAEMFGMGSHGAMFGMSIMVANLGGATGPLVTGSIFDATHSYQLAFGLVAVLSAACLVLTLLLKPVRRTD